MIRRKDFKKHYFFYLLIGVHLLNIFSINAQNDDVWTNDKKQWFSDNIQKINTIHPSDTDYNDLKFLKDILKDERFVILGEPTHGDGKVFKAKSRLIKYLHEELKFDVLVFESGFYDVQSQMQNATTTNEVLKAATKSIPRVWSESKQAYPAIKYVSQTEQTRRPLILEGMDVQFNDSYSLFIEEFASETNIKKHLNEDYANFINILQELLKNHLYKASEEDQNFFINKLDYLKIVFKRKKNIDLKRKSFWLQMLENIRALALTSWEQNLAFRERQMADNLLWLAENKYPNKKIIVWMASIYSFKNKSIINTMNPKLKYGAEESFGDKLETHFNKIYTIGFTAIQGEYGAFYWNSEPEEISKPSQNSLEGLFDNMNIEFGFLDLNKMADSELWKNKKVLSKPLGYSEMKSVWYKNFDGLFFIKTMEPSTELDK